MDRQLEERIRERAYELWMRHGSIHGRADEYWFQAEREVLGEGDEAEGAKARIIDPAPLGMTSMTVDEELPSPVAPKARRKKSAPAEVGGDVPAAPKRKRTPRPV